MFFFYKITPYIPETDGYIHYFLASKYSSRNQLLGIPSLRTTWIGIPPESFEGNLRKEISDLRKRMSEAIHSTIIQNEHISELDAYRATDEINEWDKPFLQ